MIAARPLLALVAVLISCSSGERPAASGLSNDALPPGVDSLLAPGRSKYSEQQFTSARDLWLTALRFADARKNQRAKAELLTWIGLATWRLGVLDSARMWQERAIDVRSALGPPNGLWRSYNALGLLLMSEAKNDSAAALFELALTYATRERSAEGVAKATGNAALAYGYLGDLQRARAGHRAMRAAGRKLKDVRVEANGLANEAMIDLWEGDVSSGTSRLDTARKLYKSISDAVGEQNALGQLAVARELSGNYGGAFASLDSALRLARAHSLSESVIETLRILGGLHLELGDPRRAIVYFDEAESLARKNDIDSDLGSILRGSAGASARMGDTARARAKALEARRLHKDSEEPLDEIDDLLLLAELEGQSSSRRTTSAYLSAADSLAVQTQLPLARAVVAIAAARLDEARGKPAEALLRLRIVRRNSAAFPAGIIASAAAIASRSFLMTGALDSALDAGAEAVRMLDRVRGNIAGEAMRSAFVADRAQVYGDYVIALLRSGRNEAAFEIADRARSHSLIEHLTEVRGSQRRQGVAAELIESEVMLRRIDALLDALSRTKPPGSSIRSTSLAIGPAEAERLEKARSDYERLVIRASQSDASSTAVLGAAKAGVDKVRRVLAPGEVLVEYFLGADTLYTFVVRGTKLSIVRTATDQQALAQRIRLLADLWGSPRKDWQIGLTVSSALHDVLIEPVVRLGVLDGARRLVIVPHGGLAQVPFAALMNSRSRRFLMQDYSLVETPSAGAFVALRMRGGSRNVFAAHVEAFAPFPDELPGTAREAEAIRRSSPKARSHVGSSSTEAMLRASLQRGDIVHIATHGILNFRNPMFSGVELARGGGMGQRKGGSDDDGRLEVRELLALEVFSPLVFLSGCETGASDKVDASGIVNTGDLNLSQAFLSAGALNVVSSIWRIDDAGAARFAELFHSRLRPGMPGDALAFAQHSLARDATYGSPYYWAGYVLSGEGRSAIPQRIAMTAVK